MSGARVLARVCMTRLLSKNHRQWHSEPASIISGSEYTAQTILFLHLRSWGHKTWLILLPSLALRCCLRCCLLLTSAARGRWVKAHSEGPLGEGSSGKIQLTSTKASLNIGKYGVINESSSTSGGLAGPLGDLVPTTRMGCSPIGKVKNIVLIQVNMLESLSTNLNDRSCWNRAALDGRVTKPSL